MQAQRQVAAGCQDGMDPRREVYQQPGELAEGLWRAQLVEVINDQRYATVSGGQLGEDPVGHHGCAEPRRRCGRLGTGGSACGVTDGVEQGKPEILRVPLVTVHLYRGELVRAAQPAGPGTQQRRLPAAGRSRDDRYLSLGRAVKGGTQAATGD